LGNFQPFLGNSVFEAGCGSGNLTSHLLDRKVLKVVDIDPVHVEAITARFGHLENLETSVCDLESPDTYTEAESYDSVLCVNVLEHLDEPYLALKGFHRILRKGGHALVLVPAHDWLFSEADRALQHRKRYSASEVQELLTSAGFEVVKSYEFNRLGVVGWYTNKILGRTTITKLQARLFGLLLPIAKLVERLTVLPGLSVVAVARKP